MKDFAYISVVDAVCPARQCPLTVDGGIPLAWDHAHLTAEGSVYVMERLMPMLGLNPSFRVRLRSGRTPIVDGFRARASGAPE